ncbi:MAG: hypothetical protein ACTSUK_02600, partial [Promethearchaeota archaeon]
MIQKSPQVVEFSPPVFPDLNRSRLLQNGITSGIGLLLFIISAVFGEIFSENAKVLLYWTGGYLIWLLLWWYDNSSKLFT